MFIVDAQVHIWAANTAERPWPVYPGSDHPNPPHKPVPMTAESVLADMDRIGIARAILIPPSWEGDRNDQVLAAAHRYPQRFAAVGRFDASAPDARDALARWREQTGMIGVQMTFQKPYFEAALSDGSIDWVWAVAEQAGIPVNLYAPHRLLHHIDRVAERHPGLKLLLNHFALTGTNKDAAAFANFTALLNLARRPNVAVKASCMPFYTTERYPFPSLQPYVRQVYDAFGPQRMFWGTDLSRLPCTWEEGLRFFTEAMTWLSDEDKHWIMGRGVCAWHGWQMPKDLT